MPKTRIRIVGNDDVVRQGLSRILAPNPNWEVLGEASNATQAVELSEPLDSDIVVLDLNMHEVGGLEAIRRILKTSPQMPILALSPQDSDRLIHEVLGAGVKGYLLQ